MVQASSERRIDLDFIRIVAIIGVIGIHCLAPLVVYLPTDSNSWIVGNFLLGSLRWAVPVFVMLSGALIIKPTSEFSFKAFYKKRASRIILPIIAWPIIYLLWYNLSSEKDIGIKTFLYEMLAGQPSVGYHLYFLFLIAGLYIIAPYLSIIASKISSKAFLATAIAMVTATSVWYHIQVLLPEHSVSLNALTQGLPYIGYFMLGFALRNVQVKSLGMILTASFVTIFAGTFATFLTYSHSENLVIYGYNSWYIAILSPLVFLALSALYSYFSDKISLLEPAVKLLAPSVFGVFLVHLLILFTISDQLGLDRRNIRDIPALFMLTTILSWAIVSQFRKVPYIKNIFG